MGVKLEYDVLILSSVDLSMVIHWLTELEANVNNLK